MKVRYRTLLWALPSSVGKNFFMCIMSRGIQNIREIFTYTAFLVASQRSLSGLLSVWEYRCQCVTLLYTSVPVSASSSEPDRYWNRCNKIVFFLSHYTVKFGGIFSVQLQNNLTVGPAKTRNFNGLLTRAKWKYEKFKFAYCNFI